MFIFKKELFLLLVAFAAFFSLGLSFVSADCVKTSEGFFECVEEKYISLDESVGEELDPNKMVLDLSEININTPAECKTDFCYEESSIVVIVKKTWKPLTALINNNSLTSWGFAKEFPSIVEKEIVSNKSSVYDRVVLQKILYDRGLLGVKPTGKIGYLTELAIMKLQCIKGFSEYDATKTIFEIGPKTIEELNTLKDRMKDNDYLSSTQLPKIDLSTCGGEFESRYKTINSLMKTPPTWADNDYNNMITPDSSLEWGGEVIIKKID